jgi:hypothetical protein
MPSLFTFDASINSAFAPAGVAEISSFEGPNIIALRTVLCAATSLPRGHLAFFQRTTAPVDGSPIQVSYPVVQLFQGPLSFTDDDILSPASNGNLWYGWSADPYNFHSMVAVVPALVTLGLKFTVNFDIVARAAKPGYHNATGPFAPAALPTDVWWIASRTGIANVWVKKIRISGTATAASAVRMLLIKRSTLDTGGAVINPTTCPDDTRNPVTDTATTAYTANPGALGATVATLWDETVPVGTTAAPQPETVLDLSANPCPLRGVAQNLALNLAGVTTAGLSLSIVAEVYETPPYP